MKKLLIILYLSVLSPLLPVIGTAQFAVAQRQAVWIDVRTEQEYNAGHLKGAVLIPHQQIAQKIATVVKDKRQPIKLYCRSGRRAEIALRTLEQLGYTNVQNRGSFEVLKASGIK